MRHRGRAQVRRQDPSRFRCEDPDWLDDSIVDAKSDVAPKLDSPKGNATVNSPGKMPA